MMLTYTKHAITAAHMCAAVMQPVKEVSPSYELFDIMGKKEDRRGEEWNSGNWITGETW